MYYLVFSTACSGTRSEQIQGHFVRTSVRQVLRKLSKDTPQDPGPQVVMDMSTEENAQPQGAAAETPVSQQAEEPPLLDLSAEMGGIEAEGELVGYSEEADSQPSPSNNGKEEAEKNSVSSFFKMKLDVFKCILLSPSTISKPVKLLSL